MAISRAQLVKELEPGLNALFGLEYKNYADDMVRNFRDRNFRQSFRRGSNVSRFLKRGKLNLKDKV